MDECTLLSSYEKNSFYDMSAEIFEGVGKIGIKRDKMCIIINNLVSIKKFPW